MAWKSLGSENRCGRSTKTPDLVVRRLRRTPRWGHDELRKIPVAGDASRMMRRKLLIQALYAIGGCLPMLAFAGTVDFSVIQVDSHQASERFDGFQLATLAQTSTVNIRVNHLQDRIKRHTHPSSDHFLYVIKGQVELSVGDERRILGMGDFVTIPLGTPHAMRRVGDSEAVFLDVASPPDLGDVIWHE
jgi:mannose-6-phosphate isomerase-like protein (cupin superfamily)